MNKTGLRYERKFFITELSFRAVEHVLKMNYFHFTEIYHSRFVNNIYFDTTSLQCFDENILGVSDRFKIRIRWYGDLFSLIEKPILELKIKKGNLGKKHSIPLDQFKLEPGSPIIKQIPKLKEMSKRINFDLSIYKPTLINRYQRKYFLSKDKKYRVTVDNNQSFSIVNRNTPFKKIRDRNSIIVELKYDENNDKSSQKVSNGFPFRLTKSSKYVRGLSLIQSI
jgi:SPX domain protein involved in polyphosphate accumulation